MDSLVFRGASSAGRASVRLAVAAALLAASGPRGHAADPMPDVGDPAPYRVNEPVRPRPLPHNTAPPARYGLVISIDGVSHDLYRRHRFRLRNLLALERAGFRRPLETVFPSTTWAAHVSLVTGQYPRHHGVLGNRWVEGQRLVRSYRSRDIDDARRRRSPSIYDLAAGRGWLVAALNWPATQGSKLIHYNLPETMYDENLPYELVSPALGRLLRARARRELGRHRSGELLRSFFGRVLESERLEADLLVRDMVGWLIRPHRPRWLRPERALCTPRQGKCFAPDHGRPRLLLAHLLLPDTLMHRYGTNDWVARWGLEQADAMVGDILRAYRRAGILRQTAVFVVSDHGFAEIERTMNLPRALEQAGLGAAYQVTLNGHAAFLYRKGSAATDRQAALALRSSRYASCVEAVYAPPAYAQLGLPSPPTASGGRTPSEHPGAPSLIALAVPSCLFRDRGAPTQTLGGRRIGFHGYLPRHRSMHALMIGKGPGIRARGPLALARITDVAPTLAWLLGLSWPSHWPAFADRPFTLDGAPLLDVLVRPGGAVHAGAGQR